MTQDPNAKPAGFDAALDLLMTQGWCVIPNALPRETIDALDADLAPIYEATPFCEGDFYGGRTKRFGSLLKRSPHAAALAMDALILAVSEAVLSPWCDTLQLNLMQAIALHPGAPAQFPHRDQDMWQGVKGEVEYLVNVMWPLTRFTVENGGTIIYPGMRSALLDGPARHDLRDQQSRSRPVPQRPGRLPAVGAGLRPQRQGPGRPPREPVLVRGECERTVMVRLSLQEIVNGQSTCRA